MKEQSHASLKKMLFLMAFTRMQLLWRGVRSAWEEGVEGVLFFLETDNWHFGRYMNSKHLWVEAFIDMKYGT